MDNRDEQRGATFDAASGSIEIKNKTVWRSAARKSITAGRARKRESAEKQKKQKEQQGLKRRLAERRPKTERGKTWQGRDIGKR